MNPIVHTARQLRVLCAFTNRHNDRCGALVWQPDFVFATDSHRMLWVPLPNDPERSFALLARHIEPWLIGYPDVPGPVKIGLGGWERPGPLVSATMTIERIDAISAKIYEQGARSFVTVQVDNDDRALMIQSARTLAFEGGPGFASHFVDPQLLGEVHGAHKAFGTTGSLTLVGAPSMDRPIVYGFPSEHGEARYVVMPRRAA